MKTTIGWAAVGQDGIATEWGCGTYGKFEIYPKRFAGAVRVEIREAKEKKRKAGRKGAK
jgi:hypothetical protein